MATQARKTAQKSLMSNPPRSRYVSRKKSSTTRRRRRNPATQYGMAKKNPTTARRRRAVRNPGASTNAALLAIGGALVINIFDEGVNRFMPALSNPFRIGAKAVGGYVIGVYGKKFLGGWAQTAQNALWLAAALDAFQVYVRPMLGGWLTPAGAPVVVQQQQIQNPATGELGTRLFTSDGNSMDVFEGSSEYAY